MGCAPGIYDMTVFFATNKTGRRLSFETNGSAIAPVLNLPNTDVRTLTNSMRAMLTDANTQSIIPVGNSNSLILTGPAASPG